ncbi:conserved hypothetical protein [Ricinus communis]|uniref:Uncharacterized protein n=1 Tax=Ricinus communis TaxID=3988 RepID=B9RSK7_RICCO|nr:conserved hypothetical protein [Ricinus communis]
MDEDPTLEDDRDKMIGSKGEFDDDNSNKDDEDYYDDEDNIEDDNGTDKVVQKLLIVASFDPRVSGLKAYEFVQKSRFNRSYRVEALGFSVAVWLL